MHKSITMVLGTLFILVGFYGTASAAKFTDTSFGISMYIDNDLVKQPRVRELQFFSAPDMSGLVLIKRYYDLSVTDFMRELKDTGYRSNRDGIFFDMAGEPREADIRSGLGAVVPVDGQVTGQRVRGYLGVFSGYEGQGFMVVATAKPEHWESWLPRLLAGSHLGVL